MPYCLSCKQVSIPQGIIFCGLCETQIAQQSTSDFNSFNHAQQMPNTLERVYPPLLNDGLVFSIATNSEGASKVFECVACQGLVAVHDESEAIRHIGEHIVALQALEDKLRTQPPIVASTFAAPSMFPPYHAVHKQPLEILRCLIKYCNNSFYGQPALDAHMSRHRRRNNILPRPGVEEICCQYCRKSLSNEGTQRADHESAHIDFILRLPFQCLKCPESFPVAENANRRLTAHYYYSHHTVRASSYVNRYLCQLCNQVFNDAHKACNHIYTRHEDRQDNRFAASIIKI